MSISLSLSIICFTKHRLTKHLHILDICTTLIIVVFNFLSPLNMYALKYVYLTKIKTLHKRHTRPLVREVAPSDMTELDRLPINQI